MDQVKTPRIKAGRDAFKSCPVCQSSRLLPVDFEVHCLDCDWGSAAASGELLSWEQFCEQAITSDWISYGQKRKSLATRTIHAHAPQHPVKPLAVNFR